ncbi:MAG: hypothetical protein J1E57_02080 [Prevotella sp.]|nr:hypothetical protein [Prevotella sp.]
MKIYFALIAAAILMMSVACSNKNTKTREEKVAEFRNSLTETDTLEMLKICDTAMEHLKSKHIEDVLASLYEYNDSTQEVKPLSEEVAKKYRRTFTIYPVLEYTRKYYSFQLEGCNDVKYDVVFATAEQAGTKEPAKTAYMFNPVKVDGQWFLCVKTASDEIDETRQ